MNVPTLSILIEIIPILRKVIQNKINPLERDEKES